MLNRKALKFICCPTCKKTITEKKEELLCRFCERSYKIKNGIPILIDYKKLTPHLRKQIKYFEREKASVSKKYKLEHWQELYLERFLKHAKDKSLIYDCGSGSGYMAIELAKRGYKVIASDLTYKSVYRIKRIAEKFKIENNMFFVCSLAEEIPLKDESVSEFISLAVLEHLSNESESIQEWKRVTKRQGLIFITVPLMFRYVFPLLWLPNYIHDKRIGHLRRYDYNSLKRKFSLPIKRVYYTGHLIKIAGMFVGAFFPKSIRWFEDFDDSQSKTSLWANNITVAMYNRGKNEK